MNNYIGHPTQIAGVEEHRLVGGRGDGMRLLEIRNGLGLHLTVSADRAADISRLEFLGRNMGYFSPCGYVAPTYYDRLGAGFLKSFTAGFLTTCGLQAVGAPCTDNGEELPMHGTLSNTPAEQLAWRQEGDELVVEAAVPAAVLFGAKLTLYRQLHISLVKNSFEVRDAIVNGGDTREPVEVLYHMNMGYPLLDEDSVLEIPSEKVEPRNAHAAEGLADWMHPEKPTPGYEERCFYHTFGREGRASIWQPKLNTRLTLRFDPRVLNCFTEWKMMGCRDYVLGLEPGNCLPDGRDVMRQKGLLQFLEAGQSLHCGVSVELENTSV